MIASFKIISLASALSAGIVTAYDLPQVRDSAAPMGKTYYDRVLPSEPVEGSRAVTVAATMPETTGSVAGATQSGKSDQLRTDPTCASQTWPNISRDCLVAENGTPVRKAARTITIEKREGANTSILVRVPTTGVASR